MCTVTPYLPTDSHGILYVPNAGTGEAQFFDLLLADRLPTECEEVSRRYPLQFGPLDVEDNLYTFSEFRGDSTISRNLEWGYDGVLEAGLAYNFGLHRHILAEMREVEYTTDEFIAEFAGFIYQFSISEKNCTKSSRFLVRDLTEKTLAAIDWINANRNTGFQPTWQQTAFYFGILSKPKHNKGKRNRRK